MTKHISNLLPTAFPETNWKVKLLVNWPTIMKNLQDKVHLERIEEHSLILGVYHSSWMQELYVLSPILIEKINEQLDSPRIKQLRFKMVSKRKKTNTQVAQKRQTPSIALQLTPDEQQALKKITDTELKSALTHFLHRCRNS